MWLSILLKEPVCKQFFVAFRFVIYKTISFKGNSSLAPALEIVGGTEVSFSFRFDVLVLMFPRTRISVISFLKNKESPCWTKKRPYKYGTLDQIF